MSHLPVMSEAVLEVLDVKERGVYLDSTFGGGGYSRKILERGPAKLFAIDCDPQARERACEIESSAFVFLEGNFGSMRALIGDVGEVMDGIVFDLGFSSYQLEDFSRGFSYIHDSPLDMRMAGTGETAAEILNRCSEKELRTLFSVYGEEPCASAVARAVVSRRRERVFSMSRDFVEVIWSACHPPTFRKWKPVARIFQALRIAVNDELRRLQSGLEQACDFLKTGGVMVVVSFHSLEDRLVKRFFSQKLFPLSKKPLLPSSLEVERNPRAASAKMRAAVKAQEHRVL